MKQNCIFLSLYCPRILRWEIGCIFFTQVSSDRPEREKYAVTIFMILDNANKSMFLYKKCNLNRLPKTRKCCQSLTFLWYHCIGIDTYSKILQYTLFLHFGLMVLYIFWLTINKWKTKNLNLKNRLHFKSELSTQL